MADKRELSSAQMDVYRRTALQKAATEQTASAARRKRGWALAKEAARLVKEEFGASRVLVFGSLVHQASFNRWSDVDIAAWGLRPEDTFRAMGAVQALAQDIELNLVDVQTGRAELVISIEAEGVEV
ncbi:MAG: nucleotidyltransferase domain-containing protein [Candidatus Latescibacteria bacterium]|nr:nucleotidyltransferase domain-containing protein [Candidatus Latescibacterota bacterium]